MPTDFKGKWRISVLHKDAAAPQRFTVQGASAGSGSYAGVIGTTVVAEGSNWTVSLEWASGSVWTESATTRSIGSLSPLVDVVFLRGDNGDGDYNDLALVCESLDAIFDIVQRPFALDRGTLTMSPDGIFDASQSIQYMGVRIRNTWSVDWDPTIGVMIGIANGSRGALKSQGIQVLDGWNSFEQRAFQQELFNGFVKVPNLAISQECMVYFKLDLTAALPSKPEIGFVAQRDPAWDPAYDQASRQVNRPIFVTRSTYDPAKRELISTAPEGSLYLRLTEIVVDGQGAKQAFTNAVRNPCRRVPPPPADQGPTGSPRDLRRRYYLRASITQASAGEQSQGTWAPNECNCPPPGDTRPGTGGLADGGGADDWCRYKPYFWVPVGFEYRVVPNPPYVGQFGPLPFQDPWWKALAAWLAGILGASSVAYDYLQAGADPKYIIGYIAKKSDRAKSLIDAATASLNGSRGIDLNVQEAQNDDPNNSLPITGKLGGDVPIDRSISPDFPRGVIPAQPNTLVFKSGARTGTTRGQIDNIHFVPIPPTIDGVDFTHADLVSILQLAAPQNQPLGEHGDSGSVWVDLTTMRPTALHFAAPEDDSGTQAIANHMDAVAELLDIHFDT